jgi:hypothetical protein
MCCRSLLPTLATARRVEQLSAFLPIAEGTEFGIFEGRKVFGPN